MGGTARKVCIEEIRELRFSGVAREKLISERDHSSRDELLRTLRSSHPKLTSRSRVFLIRFRLLKVGSGDIPQLRRNLEDVHHVPMGV
jgi:hypothetical protein